ncbi:hypothetical protein P0Y35_03150 [Kiritimatiellaeota bacterium B1221]|nr:hypothetical protein [Kiritimatiellaeota bacterium B1221]
MNPDLDFIPPPPDPEISPEFQDEVISRIHHFHRRRQRIVNLVVFGLVLTTSFYVRRTRNAYREIPVKQDARVASAAKGVEWLVEAQKDDGTWDTGNSGGHAAFADGVSALATLALLNAPDPVNREVLEKAVHSLEQSMGEPHKKPLQGPEFYNWMLSLHTLAEVEKQMPNPHRQKLLTQSYTNLLRRQLSDGGWGYLDEQPMGYIQNVSSNSAVTWWICHLLKNRPALHVPGAEKALARGTAWLDERRMTDGKVAYQSSNNIIADKDDALFWMIALQNIGQTSSSVTGSDAYRDFFKTAVVQTDADLKAIQQRQTPDGSWVNPQDRWWRAGGQVYLTAMSVLSQVPKGA